MKGSPGPELTEAVCTAPLHSCTKGWAMFTSLLLDLKPPRLVMRKLRRRRRISLSQTKVLFSKACHSCGGMRSSLPKREYNLQYHLYLCDCIDEGS